jgi:hypothetical protein
VIVPRPWLRGRLRLAVAIAVAIMTPPLAPAVALAAPPANDGAAKEAKALGRAGLTLFDKGDYAGALENFKRAYAMYPVPTLGVFTARSLVKLGRLLEARDLYGKVLDTPLERGADETMKRAVDDARRERADLGPRIPTLTLTVRGATGPIRAILDDKELVPGAPVEVDPGDHRVEASANGRTERASVRVAESERREVPLDLTPPPPEPAVAPVAEARATSPLRTAGFVAVGVGGAGLATGAALGIAAIAEKSSLDSPGVCATPTTCNASARGKVDTYNTLRTSSAIALYAGAGLAAVGVVVILAAPKKNADAAALVIGPGHARLEGRF